MHMGIIGVTKMSYIFLKLFESMRGHEGVENEKEIFGRAPGEK